MVVVSGGGGNAWAKEMTIRRRIASIFNKTRDHFPTLKDYNDYLEEVEDMSGLFVLFVNLSFVNHTYLGKLSRA